MSSIYFTDFAITDEHIMSSFQVIYLNYQDFDNAHIEWHMDQFIKDYFNYDDSQQEQISSHLIKCVSYKPMDEAFILTYKMRDHIIVWDVNKTSSVGSREINTNISCTLHNLNDLLVDLPFIEKIITTINAIKQKFQQTSNTYNADFIEEMRITDKYEQHCRS